MHEMNEYDLKPPPRYSCSKRNTYNWRIKYVYAKRNKSYGMSNLNHIMYIHSFMIFLCLSSQQREQNLYNSVCCFQ